MLRNDDARPQPVLDVLSFKHKVAGLVYHRLAASRWVQAEIVNTGLVTLHVETLTAGASSAWWSARVLGYPNLEICYVVDCQEASSLDYLSMLHDVST